MKVTLLVSVLCITELLDATMTCLQYKRTGQLEQSHHKDTKTQRKMGNFGSISPETERAARETVDAALKVHRVLGPGLLESVYAICLAHELKQRGLTVSTQVAFPVVYEDMRLDAGLRLDMLVEHLLIVELKAVERMHPVYEAQLLSYLKLTGHRLGLLINFHVPLLKDGIKRIIL